MNPFPGSARPGLFVAIEGIDGAGSTTQVEALTRRLRAAGHAVCATREPSDGTVGRYVRSILARELEHPADPATMALLFAADRLDHHATVIAPALAAGQIVLSDRYVMSSLAYQGPLTGDPAWVAQLNRAAPQAELTVLLDLPVELAAARRGGRELEQIYEVDAVQRRVAEEYRRLAAASGAVVLDARRTAESLTEELLVLVERRLEEMQG